VSIAVSGGSVTKPKIPKKKPTPEEMVAKINKAVLSSGGKLKWDPTSAVTTVPMGTKGTLISTVDFATGPDETVVWDSITGDHLGNGPGIIYQGDEVSNGDVFNKGFFKTPEWLKSASKNDVTDLEYFEKNMLSALKVPKEYLLGSPAEKAAYDALAAKTAQYEVDSKSYVQKDEHLGSYKPLKLDGHPPGSPDINLNIKQIGVNFKTKKLTAKWSADLEQDMKAYHGIDAKDEMVKILTSSIQDEIDKDILNDLTSAVALGASKWPTKFPKINKVTPAQLSPSIPLDAKKLMMQKIGMEVYRPSFPLDQRFKQDMFPKEIWVNLYSPDGKIETVPYVLKGAKPVKHDGKKFFTQSSGEHSVDSYTKDWATSFKTPMSGIPSEDGSEASHMIRLQYETPKPADLWGPFQIFLNVGQVDCELQLNAGNKFSFGVKGSGEAGTELIPWNPEEISYTGMKVWDKSIGNPE
jgi:hypothetical protein